MARENILKGLKRILIKNIEQIYNLIYDFRYN